MASDTITPSWSEANDMQEKCDDRKDAISRVGTEEAKPEEISTLSRRVTKTLSLAMQKMDDITAAMPFEEQGEENDFEGKTDAQEKEAAQEKDATQRKLTKHDVGWRHVVRNFTPS
jgi:prolyl-tRNA editing enzyme YbaK/EbsC (Cys-tRNA(Pro) deacylase)